MNHAVLAELPIPELLRLTQTNVTSDPAEGFDIATFAYGRAETTVDRGVAARQAGFRAEQANLPSKTVEEWLGNSRTALASVEPPIQRELIATELLTGRAWALRCIRTALTDAQNTELATSASAAFARGESILQKQHERGEPWDRFGTMLARHRATHEAMHGRAGFAFATATRGIWRAIHAKNEGTPEGHLAFVRKQAGVNMAAGALALSRPLDSFSWAATRRRRFALRLLG